MQEQIPSHLGHMCTSHTGRQSVSATLFYLFVSYTILSVGHSLAAWNSQSVGCDHACLYDTELRYKQLVPFCIRALCVRIISIKKKNMCVYPSEMEWTITSPASCADRCAWKAVCLQTLDEEQSWFKLMLQACASELDFASRDINQNTLSNLSMKVCAHVTAVVTCPQIFIGRSQWVTHS